VCFQVLDEIQAAIDETEQEKADADEKRMEEVRPSSFWSWSRHGGLSHVLCAA
jgi:hypothetical protein